MITTFTTQFVQDLHKLKEEIRLYKNESDLWKTQKDIKNSAGNLALHLIGNLNHFIGAQLGKTGYIRQRDNEFADKNIPLSKINSDIDQTITMMQKTLSSLKDTDLQNPYPIEFAGKNRTNGELLLILSNHFNYHLGQINYHRRMV